MFVDKNVDGLHAPRGGHVAMTLTIAFNLLNVGFEYCTYKALRHDKIDQESDEVMDAELLPPLHLDPSQLEVSEY